MPAAGPQIQSSGSGNGMRGLGPGQMPGQTQDQSKGQIQDQTQGQSTNQSQGKMDVKKPKISIFFSIHIN
jgi:hypothetical protein